MPFCSLCKDIPWETLPSFPDLSYTIGQHSYIQRYYDLPEGYRGYPHHRSIEALRISATVSNCDLCRLILKQVELCREAALMDTYGMPLWVFWIVKRGNGGNGFWVMSLTDRAEGQVALVAAIGLCVRDGENYCFIQEYHLVLNSSGDPLESIIRGRPVEQHGGTLKAITRVRKWVNECDEHPRCFPGETLLPSRVIDVGVNVDSPHVKLYETGAHDRGKYISLSYCWGDTPGYKTEKATLADRKRRIVISDLPKTHRDTIQMTRHLGIRYLWVDSICICQDDQKDWEQESAKMLSIYRNAYLTVSASRAEDSSQGLFGERPAREYIKLEQTFNNLRGQALAYTLPLDEEVHDVYSIHMLKEPLSDRGWTLQERVGSSRTVHYGTSQLSFECNEGFQGEDGRFLKSRFESVGTLEQKSEEMKQQGLETGDESGRVTSNKSDILRSWEKLVRLYGWRRLTYASDKLPAISGLASFFAKLLDDEYVAGIWRSQLPERLLWQGFPRRVQEYRAPSWSWASVDGNTSDYLTRDHYKDYKILAKVLNVNVYLKGANPYGEVNEASIEMRAPMERLYITTKDWDPHKERTHSGIYPKVSTENGIFEGVSARFDFDHSADDGPQEALRIVKSLEGVDLFALILSRVKLTDSGGFQYEGLIIRKVNSGGNYQRLGTIYFYEEALAQKPEERSEGELPIVVLI